MRPFFFQNLPFLTTLNLILSYFLFVKIDAICRDGLMNIKLLSLCFFAAIVLSACEGGKMQKMSNQELAAKSDACVQGNPTSPGKVTACENVKKECERRRKEGNFAC